MTDQEKIEALYNALKWFIENDDTNRGGEWEELNKYWIDGYNRGVEALSLINPDEANSFKLNPNLTSC